MQTSFAGFLLTALLLTPLYAVAAAAPAPTAPSPNWYNVELIVLRYTDPSASSMETWPANPGIPDWNSAVALTAAGSKLPYMQLPDTVFRMDYSWRKLQRSSDYAPLLHLAWAQPAIDRASALFVRVGTPPIAMTAASAGSLAPAAAANTAVNAPNSVYGIAKLSTTGLYLHFDLDLVYCGPPAKHLIASTASPAATPANAPSASSTTATTMPAPCQPYRLREDRRIDAGKMNYFDNPMFGVLLLVTPRGK